MCASEVAGAYAAAQVLKDISSTFCSKSDCLLDVLEKAFLDLRLHLGRCKSIDLRIGDISQLRWCS